MVSLCLSIPVSSCFLYCGTYFDVDVFMYYGIIMCQVLLYYRYIYKIIFKLNIITIYSLDITIKMSLS